MSGSLRHSDHGDIGRFESDRGHVTRNKHTREDTVTKDAKGDVVNMRGTIPEASHVRPYTPGHTDPKHAKD